MNLRQWARATQKRIADQPVELYHKPISMTEVEMILRVSIQVLAESLMRGDDLRLRDLGRLWVEEKAPRRMVSNLPRHEGQYDLEERKVLQFQVSDRLATLIRSEQSTPDSPTR